MPQSDTPRTGHFILHSNVVPKVLAGHYELVSEQTGTPFPIAPETTSVYVAAPRYVMPTDQILSTFPPANAEGSFSDRLPQIVLKRRTLPWERNPAGGNAPSTKPWLALVVVAEGEAELSTTRSVAECVTPGTELFEPEDKDVEQGLCLIVTETVVKKIFPCEEDLELLVHVRHVDINDTELANGDDDGWLAVVLANRLPVYDTANGRPVRYMACLVNIEGQLPALPEPEDEPPNHFTFELAQDWSVLAALDPRIGADPRVMGGISAGNITLPAPGVLQGARPSGAMAAPGPVARANASPRLGAALDGSSTMREAPAAQNWASVTQQVSAAALDPDARRLVRDTMASGFRFPIELFAMEKVYHFPVLAHWSFTTNDGATFETLMRDIDVGLLGTLHTPKEGAPPAPEGPELVETGHIGLDHRTRRGDPVKAWYRGPLVPFPTERDPVDQTRPVLAHSADQIRRVVPDGREDLSLAAAFEIGRLLGLSQLSVVSALLRFRAEQFGAGRVREILAQVTPFEVPEIRDQRIDLGRFVALQMIGTLAQNPATMIGPRRPIADPGRDLNVTDDLNTVIASGLGLDLAAVEEMSQQVGILAAITQAQVPIANPKGQVPLNKASVAHLRSALTTELNRVVDVARPPIIIGAQPTARRTSRSGKRPAADAKPAKDALDELIERAADLNEEDE
jgi:hypothetical protein